MSKPRLDLPNSVSAARKVVERYTGSGLFSKVYIVASRSPKSKKKSISTSDWDFYFIGKTPNIRLPSLRETKQLHGDIVIIFESDTHLIMRNDMVEIYPNDEHGILKDAKEM